MMYPIITISREFGSGGHSIGKKVAEQLGVPFFDEEIVREAAERSGESEAFVEEKGESASYSDTHQVGNFFPNMYGVTPQDRLFRVQSQIIVENAKKGPCVIVGRCADFVLEANGIPSFDVFIHADEDVRKARILQRYGATKTPIEKRVQQKDKGRKTYYNYHTDRIFGMSENYDLSLNSGTLGEDYCVELIIKTAEKFGK